MDKIESKRNKLNLELRSLLTIIEIIDGKKEEYPDYKENSMNEEDFLTQQLELVIAAKERLINVFKD